MIKLLSLLFLLTAPLHGFRTHENEFQEKIFTYRLNKEQSELVIRGLYKLPYEEVANLIYLFNQQYASQIKQAAPPIPPDSSATKETKKQSVKKE